MHHEADVVLLGDRDEAMVHPHAALEVRLRIHCQAYFLPSGADQDRVVGAEVSFDIRVHLIEGPGRIGFAISSTDPNSTT